MLWNEAVESIAPPPEVDTKAKGRKRSEEKASAPKRPKHSDGDLSAPAAAAEDPEPHAIDIGMASTVYQIYHRAFE
jgi:hypothetical protein